VNTTRVVHSSPVWLPQTQTWMHTQARCLPASVESHVACETTQNLDQFGLPHIHALAAGSKLYHLWDKLVRGLGLRRHLGHLPRVLQRVGAHLLHSHFGHIGWTNLAAARRRKIPHVVTYYGQDLSYLPRQQPVWNDRYRDLFAQVEKVLCEGPHMARCVVEMGCPEHKVQVHHLGVDLGRLRFEPRQWDGATPLRVLMAGSFTEKKGFPDAIRALAILKDRVDILVTVVGDASAHPRNQEEKRRILAAIAECGLTDHVTLLGYQPHARLMEEACRHHLFLSPSVQAADGDTEGGAPVTIIEMAATGMPVVSTLHCDIPEVILQDVGGLLANEHDPEQLAAHLTRLAEDPQSWKAMSTAARRHLEQHYDMHRQGEALAGIYRSVLGSQAGS
jgi:colanic acid/amylovoran biosynthesis glycosyltransferase